MATPLVPIPAEQHVQSPFTPLNATKDLSPHELTLHWNDLLKQADTEHAGKPAISGPGHHDAMETR